MAESIRLSELPLLGCRCDLKPRYFYKATNRCYKVNSPLTWFLKAPCTICPKNLKKIFALGDSSLLTVTEDNCKTFTVTLKFYWRKYDIYMIYIWYELITICAKKLNFSTIMSILTWHRQYRLSRSERKPFKEFFCFSTFSWLTADSLKWCWTPTFAAHHWPRLMNRVDICVWIAVWIADDRLCESFGTSDHDVDESLTSYCCHGGSPFLCELHFGYNLLYFFYIYYKSFFMD